VWGWAVLRRRAARVQARAPRRERDTAPPSMPPFGARAVRRRARGESAGSAGGSISLYIYIYIHICIFMYNVGFYMEQMIPQSMSKAQRLCTKPSEQQGLHALTIQKRRHCVKRVDVEGLRRAAPPQCVTLVKVPWKLRTCLQASRTCLQARQQRRRHCVKRVDGECLRRAAPPQCVNGYYG
jgi:hypothetical protein